MCWMCDHPGSTRADYLDFMRDMIACYGWGVQGVERAGPHPPWAYTVGLTLVGDPELVITGMSVRRAARMLNEQAAHMLHASAPPLGEPVELACGTIGQMVEVTEPTAHLDVAVELFGSQIQALQVVHADDRGRWPWERGYRGVYGGQPVLGPRVFARVAQPTGPGATGTPPGATSTPAGGTTTPATLPGVPCALPTGSPGERADALGDPIDPSGDQADGPSQQNPGKADQTRHRRVPDPRNKARGRPSRGSGRRRASHGPRRRSARSPARPLSPPR
jgi:hypothetical protein